MRNNNTITIKNARLLEMMKKKDALVVEGRKVYKELDRKQKRIAQLEEREKKLTQKMPTMHEDRMKKIKKEVERLMKEYNTLHEEAVKDKQEKIPAKIADEHLALLDKKKKLEEEHMKIARQVQKYKDRLLPKIQEACVQYLEETEDLGTAQIKRDTIAVQVFDPVQEYKEKIIKQKYAVQRHDK
jgi:hypothetical protein